MKTIALLDGDIYAYEIASSAEEPVHWGDGLWTLHSWEEPAKIRLDDLIEDIKETVGADEVVVCLSDTENFRKQVLPTYKDNRKDTRKPLLLRQMKEHLENNYKTFIRPTLEADDVLGILATWSGMKGRKIIVTKDKDLQTIPCEIFLTHKKERGVFTVTQEDADLWHLIQTLAGDVTDGYKGCPSIGMVRAERALLDTPPEERWAKVVELFEKQGLGEEEALVQARVARICRASDYDFKKKKVKLWTP